MVHFVIMGCGRVGSMLALSLEQQGHSVAIIDRDETAFRRLGTDFVGRRVTGIGFDRDTLREARIREADAFAAVSSGDNSNILAARVARETFDVTHVVARIYDPGRAEIYQRLGIPTVATVRWTTDQVMRRVLPKGALPEMTEPSGQITLAEVPLHVSWVGTRFDTIASASGTRVAYLTRLGTGILPEPDTVFQEGDLVHLMVHHDRLEQVEHFLAAPKNLDQ